MQRYTNKLLARIRYNDTFIWPPDVSRKGLNSWNFLFFLIFLSIHRVQQPRSGWPSLYFGGSVVGKASTVGIEISPTPPLIFTGVSAKFGVIFNITQIWAARVWKYSKISELWNKGAMQRWSPYVLAKFGEVGSTHNLRKLCLLCPTPIIARRKRANMSKNTQPWIIRFHSNFVQSLNAWQSKCRKVQCQEVKGQGHSAT